MSQQIIQNLQERINSANHEERQRLLVELGGLFNRLNVENRNANNVVELCDNMFNREHNLQEELVSFLSNESVHGLITAPTQVGKTEATRVLIEQCLKYKMPVILTADNSLSQLKQLYNRIRGRRPEDDCDLLISSDRKFLKNLEKSISEDKLFVIFCNNNAVQIKKIREKIMALTVDKGIDYNKLCLIHDEGDVITKHQNVEHIEDDAPESHKEWIKFTSFINNIARHNRQRTVDMKRVFVTATPENCLIKYGVESCYVVQLEVPSNYIGWEKIQYKSLEDWSSESMKKIIENEVIRRYETEEKSAILYNCDRKVINQLEILKGFQFIYHMCLVHTYNGSGVMCNNPDITIEGSKFESKLKEKNIKYELTDDNEYITIKDIEIKDFYQICYESTDGIVLTIGMDLMTRGISFVSSEHNKLAATTMVYKPGKGLACTAITQTIGRITGTACPDLERTLYASNEVITNYKNYNKNQREYMDEIKKSNNTITSDIIKSMSFNNKITRGLDRPKVGINKVMKFVEPPAYTSENDNIIDGVNLKNLRKWCVEGNETLVARMIRYLYNQKTEITVEEFKNGLNYEGSDFQSNIDNGRAEGAKYGKLWCATLNKIKLSKNIRKYIQTL